MSDYSNSIEWHVMSRYFELVWPHTELPLNWRKLENNSLPR